MLSVINAKSGNNCRFLEPLVPGRLLLVVVAAALTAGLSLAVCQAARRPKVDADSNSFRPPPFFGDTASIPTGRPSNGTTGPTAQTPPVASPTVPIPRPVEPVVPARRGVIKAPAWPADPLDGRVDRAIRAGLDYLYGVQKPDGAWDTKYASQHTGGVESLVLLAALEAGEDPKRPQLAKALDYINQISPKTTYVRAVRVMVYSLLPGKDYAARLAQDVTWLAGNLNRRTGGWGYGPGYRTTRENPNWVDNSNTFLAMLALRKAEVAGAKISPVIWARARGYWARGANDDGGISYQPPGLTGFRLRSSSYGSMTAAGVAALYILTDQYARHVEPDYSVKAARRPNPSPYKKAIASAIDWMSGNIVLGENPKWVWGTGEAYEYYYLYCLLQMADEGGMDRVGAITVAQGVAELICGRQKASGCWTDPAPSPGADVADGMVAIRTCFAVMALSRARGAVLIDKISFGQRAGDDSRDAANLVRWMSRSLGRAGSWRKVPLGASKPKYVAPLLYVQAGGKEMPAGLAGQIRTTLDAGGSVLVQPFGGRRDIFEAVKVYLKGLLRGYTAGDVPFDHEIYSTYFKIGKKGRPKLFALGDSCRLRVLVFEGDASGAWHQSRWADRPQLFQLPANALLYTTDLASPKSRLAMGLPQPKRAIARRRIPIARLRHAGDWNVCKGAMDRLSDVLAGSISVGLDVSPAVDASASIAPGIPVLWMTGTTPAGLTAGQKAKLKAYLTGGGTLMIDSAMGTEPLIADARAALEEMFGAGAVREMPADHPLLTGAFAGGLGSSLAKVRYTRAVGGDSGKAGPPKLFLVEIAGRAAVILSPMSVVAPLQGQPVYNCKGLAGPDAARLAANVVLYAAAGKR